MLDPLQKQTILVADDTPLNLEMLAGILKDEYNIKVAKSGVIALKIAEQFKPDLILLDIMMPEMDGYEVCKKLKQNPILKNIPVIFVTAKDQETDEAAGFNIGAVDYITKPVNPVLVKARIKTHLALYDQEKELQKQVLEKTKEISETRLKTIHMLGIASEYKDEETGAHIERMSKYCYIIAKAYGFSESDAQMLLQAAPMHDVGKISIPDSILKKPGKLTEDEFKVIQTHCAAGESLLKKQDAEIFSTAAIIALQHHEKWDGSGYPNGRKGEDINLYARIVAVSDVFDALTSKRPYKEPWEPERAIQLIISESGKQFDPRVVKAFQNSLDQIITVYNEYRN